MQHDMVNMFNHMHYRHLCLLILYIYVYKPHEHDEHSLYGHQEGKFHINAYRSLIEQVFLTHQLLVTRKSLTITRQLSFTRTFKSWEKKYLKSKHRSQQRLLHMYTYMFVCWMCQWCPLVLLKRYRVSKAFTFLITVWLQCVNGVFYLFSSCCTGSQRLSPSWLQYDCKPSGFHPGLSKYNSFMHCPL